MNLLSNTFILQYILIFLKVFSYLRARLQKGKKDISILAGFNKILKKDPHPWQENSSEQLFWNYLLWIKEEYDVSNFFLFQEIEN